MIYSKDDISKFYTKVVKENIEYGHINVRSMRGSQGEDSRIDINLGDGRIRRILVDSKYDLYLRQVIRIKVIDFMDNGSNLYWNDQGELVQIFYFIPIKGSSNSKYYMADQIHFDQAKARTKIKKETKYRVVPWTDLDSKYYPIFKKIVQSFNQPGWKRFDIKSVSTRIYFGKKYYMVEKSNGDAFYIQRNGTKFYLD